MASTILFVPLGWIGRRDFTANRCQVYCQAGFWNCTIMRLLHIVEATFAGVGRHVLDVARAQFDQGHEVHVIYSPRRMSTAFEMERQQAKGIDWHALPMRRSPGPVDIWTVAKIRRLLGRIRPQVVIGHSVKGGGLARLAAVFTDVYRVYTPNGLFSMNPDLSRHATWAAGLTEKALSWFTDVIVAVSLEEVEHLRGLGVSASKVRVVHNGIKEPQRFDRQVLRSELGVREEQLVVGFVGRLEAQKRPLDAIEIFSLAAAIDRRLRLLMVGDGILRHEVAGLVMERDLGDRVTMLGEYPGTKAMQACDLFLLPSSFEGFPYVLIEAAHLGLPIVTTDRACASAIVAHGVSGYVCRFGDLADAAACIAALAVDVGKRLEFGAAGERLARQFTVASMAEGYEAAISGCESPTACGVL